MPIEVKNLTKTFGAQTAVNDISFKVNKGEIVGFLGPNGAGKSTTFKMITGFLQPDNGFVSVNNIDVQKNNNEAKKQLGYLAESNALYYDLYVKEYLDFLCNVHNVGNKKQRIKEVIEQVGLNIEQSKKIGQLSKGYKQRVGIAGAIIHNPEILILDEPTSGLDPNQIIEIRNLVKELGKDKTILFSSHILQEVEAICEKVIIINRGNIVANDNLTNISKIKNNENVLVVSFDNNVPLSELTKHFNAKIEQLENNKFRFVFDDVAKLRQDLLAKAIENNWSIAQLSNEKTNLEDIFQQLTKTNH